MPSDATAVSGFAGELLRPGDPGGGTNLEVRVRSWYEFGWAVRYRLVYWITGNTCALPDFAIRDVGPNGL
jgi:hypothetical protein